MRFRPLVVVLLALAASAASLSAQDYVASRRGHVYYWVGCSAWKRLSKKNLIHFDGKAEAEAAGYTPSHSRGCAGPAAGSEARAKAQVASCGVERWPVKTLADPDAGGVDLTPLPSSVTQLRSLRRPPRVPSDGRVPAERHVYRLEADLIGWVAEEDSDLHLVLAAPGQRTVTLIAEIPSPDCALAASARFRSDFAAARAAVLRRLGPAPDGYAELLHPLRVVVTGVAFLDFRHGQHGLVPNAIELHPVPALTFR